MLILTRKLGEKLMIGDDIQIRVLGISGNQLRFGIEAPKHVAVHREEIYNKLKMDASHSVRKLGQEEKQTQQQEESVITPGFPILDANPVMAISG